MSSKERNSKQEKIEVSMNTQQETEQQVLSVSEFIVQCEEQRLDFLPKHFGKAYMKMESLIFANAREWDNEYNGGFWEYVELGNCGFIFPQDEREYTAATFSDSVQVNAKTFGAALTAMMLSHLSFHYHEQGDNDTAGKLADCFHELSARIQYLEEIQQGNFFKILD